MHRIVMLAAALCAVAACTPAPGIAVVDLQAVARALGRDDAMSQQVGAVNDTLRQQLRNAAERLRDELQAEQDALGGGATDDARTRFDQLLAEANRRLEETQRAALLRSSQFQQAVVNDFRREVAAIARGIADRRAIPAVLSSDASLLWYDSALDITDEVIAEMRALSRAGGLPSPAADTPPRDGGEP